MKETGRGGGNFGNSFSLFLIRPPSILHDAKPGDKSSAFVRNLFQDLPQSHSQFLLPWGCLSLACCYLNALVRDIRLESSTSTKQQQQQQQQQWSISLDSQQNIVSLLSGHCARVSSVLSFKSQNCTRCCVLGIVYISSFR
jgi:hypothetical protein